VIVLATIQIILDTSWCVGLVLAASRARRWLRRVGVRRRIERTLGTVLIALGLELAIDTR
jgi:threonine/homoserine/homoserine lactone efflux protein